MSLWLHFLLSLCFYVQPVILIKVLRLIKLITLGDKEEVYCLTSEGSNNLHKAKLDSERKKNLPKNECSVGVCMGGKRRQVKSVKMTTADLLPYRFWLKIQMRNTWWNPCIACGRIFLNYWAESRAVHQCRACMSSVFMETITSVNRIQMPT